KMSEASYRTLVFKRNLAAAQLVSDKFAGVMHKMEAVAAVGVTAATAFGKASLDEYKKFNSAMNEVAGIKGIDTMSDEFEKLVSAAKSAGDEVKGSTYIEAAESLKYLALAGYNTKQSITALPALLKAIKINGGEAATTADALTDSMSALGLTSDRANKYVDMAAAVQSASNTTMLQLQDSMIKYGSMFKNMYAEMGVSKGDMEVVKDEMAITRILASSGKKAEEAGTAINSLYSRWAKGTGEVQKGFDSIGMSIYDGNDELKSAYEIMTEIAARVKDLSPKERNAALAQIGGVRMAQSLQVMIDGFNRVGEDGQTAYEKITKAIEDSTGAADRYIDAVTSGYGGGVAMMEAEWSKLKVTAGEMIAPYVTDVLEKINENMPQIREWLKDEMPAILDGIYGGVKKITDVAIPAAEWLWEHKEGVGKGLLAAYIGMGAFRAGTGILTAADTGARLLNGINKQKAARAAIAEAAAGTTTGAAATATGTSAAAVTKVTAGEVLAPIGKIAGVAAILYMAYRNSEKLRESVRRFGESYEPIVTGFKKGLEKWEPVAKRVKESVGAAFGAVGDTLSPAVDVLSNVNEKVSSGVGWVLENAPVAVQGLLDFADALLFGDNWESGMDTLVYKWG
ncbi:MAG: phage tail tape measure protein, partial [Firmicutes bacterium]|nr:phage tail tape measure protein [Bacillota bacterium]